VEFHDPEGTPSPGGRGPDAAAGDPASGCSGYACRDAAKVAEAGVLLLPGSVYDQPGHVRIGFGRTNMPDALKVLEANLTHARQ